MVKQIFKIILTGMLLFATYSGQIIQAAPTSAFKITRNTLEHLRREGMSAARITLLSPLLNQVYPNREIFLSALPELFASQKSEPYNEALLRYASLEQLRIKADEFSSDLNENEAVFRGNVQAWIPRENIELSTAKLRLLSGKNSNYEKLIGEGGVQVKQWEREVRSDYALYTQIDLPEGDSTETVATGSAKAPQQTLQLQGNVLMKALQGAIKSDTVSVDLLRQYATLEGQNTGREGRISIEANLSELEKKEADDKSEKPATGEPKKIVILASRAVLDNIKRQAMFEGKVEMERTPEKLYLQAGKVTLRLGEEQQLLSMLAEQNVCFEQPGRVAKADQISFNEITQTILLEGNAEAQSGKYHLQGNTINLYLDVNKGLAQGDNKAPIQMTILGEQSPPAFTCR